MSNVQKVTVISPTTLSITNEDHTIMNPLRYIIQRNNKDAELVGYTIPHPAEKCVEFKIQYKKEGNILQSVCEGLNNLEIISDKLLNLLDNEIVNKQL